MRKMKNKFIVILLFMVMSVVGLGCDNRQKEAHAINYGELNSQKDFSLTDQDGHLFYLKDHRGQVVLLFFGYLSCPDVCPTMLSKLVRVYTLLGPEWKQKVLTAFISIDPNRDTSQKLKEYLEYFRINAVGLTGTKQEVDKVVEAYKASYEKVETVDVSGYLFNHSDYLYFIDGEGQVRYLFHPEDNAQKIVEAIKKSIKK